MGTMRKPLAIPFAPRLISRPILPGKKELKAQGIHINMAQRPLESVGKYVILPRQGRGSLAVGNVKLMATRANLVSAPPSDDERKPSSDSTVMSRKPSSERTRLVADSKAIKPPMTNSTGVYMDNVEIQRDAHPLQCTHEGTSPLQVGLMTCSRPGRPLSAAPLLPRRSHHELFLSPLCFTTLQSKRPSPSNNNNTIQRKKQRCDVPQEGPRIVEARQEEQTDARRKSRKAQVKEASVMIEAAVALANLRS